MREHFTLAEVAELAHVVAWYGGVHKVNALFDVEPDEADLHRIQAQYQAR